MLRVVIAAGIVGMVVVISQVVAMLHDRARERREALQPADDAFSAAYHLEVVYGFAFHLLYLVSIFGILGCYLYIREASSHEQWLSLVCVALVMLGASLRPQMNIPSKKYYWSTLAVVFGLWIVLVSLRACDVTVLPLGDSTIPLP